MPRSDEVVTIDERLFAHINTDSFLKGSVKLQGNSFSKTIGYLYQYVSELDSALVPDSVKQLQKMCKDLVEIEQEIATLPTWSEYLAEIYEKGEDSNESFATFKRISEPLAKRVFEKINKLAPGESLLMPGGWVAKERSHGVIYKWSKDYDGHLLFKVQNSGAGLSEFHEKCSVNDRILYNSVLTYKMRQPSSSEDEDLLLVIINQLIKLQLPSLHELRSISPSQLYVDIFDQFEHLHGRKCSSTDVDQSHWYTAGQVSGTCAQRALHQMLKSCFSDVDSYRKFIYGLKIKSIDDYHSVLVDNGWNNDLKYMTHFEEAIRHTLRLLMLPETKSPESLLFSSEMRHADRTKLESYLGEVRRAKLQSVLSESLCVDISIQYLHRAGFSDATHPGVQQVVSARTAVTGDVIRLKGLSQLDDVIHRCQALKVAKQHYLLLEQLESLIHNLPLPSTLTQDLLPYYSGIYDEQKSYEFYKKINVIQQLYFECYDQLIGDMHSTPTMYLAKLTLYTVIGHINHNVKLVNKGLSFYDRCVHNTVDIYFKDSPYLATQNPTLDARLSHILTLYKGTRSEFDEQLRMGVLKYYDALLDTQPELKRKLENMYSEKYLDSQAKLHTELRGLRLTALFYFFTHCYNDAFENSAFKVLIYKFETQKALEESFSLCLRRLINGRGFRENPVQFEICNDIWGESIDVNTPYLASKVKFSIDQCLVGTKYVNKDNCFQQALTLANHGMGREDNFYQVYPAQHSSFYFQHKQQTDLTPITKETLAERELFHLRVNPGFQIYLTLAYFDEHIHKLKDVNYQNYLEANLFQPALLLNQLKSEALRVEFMAKFNALIMHGLNVYQNQTGHSKTSAALFHLRYQVYQYAYLLAPREYIESINRLITDINEAIWITTSIPIKRELYLIKFRILMTKQLHGGLSRNEMNELVESRFISNRIANEQLNYDIDTKLKIERQQQDFIQLVRRRKFDPSIFKSVLEKLHLLVPTDSIITNGEYPIYFIKNAANEQVFTLNVEHGLVYKSDLAYVALPLDLLTHPAILDIGIKNLQMGFMSMDKSTYYVEQPSISVRCIFKDDVYFIQQKFRHNNSTEGYFELMAQSVEHQQKYRLKEFCRNLSFADLIKQRDMLLWKHIEKEEFIITSRENNERLLHGILSSDSDDDKTWRIDDCQKTGHLLDSTSLRCKLLQKFESDRFISFYKRPNCIEIKLFRYGISLTLSEKTKLISYHWQGNEYTLLDSPAIISGIQLLVFNHKKSKICIIPIQRLISTNLRQAGSKYYQLELDIWHRVAAEQMEKVEDKLWQHAGSQNHLVLKVEEGQPIPETSAQALYLAYLYMGTNDYINAWKMITDCERRLGGLEGTYAELQYLQWIFLRMPFSLKSDVESAEVLNPTMVACKLKALSLFTTVMNQGKDIAIPRLKAPTNDVNDLYKNKQIEEVESFYQQVNDTLFQFYKKYQQLHRESLVEFRLSEDERYSLLHYYHQQIKPKKAIDALGYDWTLLKFKALKKELCVLKSNRSSNRYEQARIKEIESLIEHHQGFAKVYSEISYVKIDTSLPERWSINITVLSDNCISKLRMQSYLLRTQSSFQDLPRTSRDQAVKLLLPGIGERQFINEFMNYLAIANDLKDPARNKLKDFCRATLFVGRHKPLANQPGNIVLLCNVLYRVLHSNSFPPAAEDYDLKYYIEHKLFTYAKTLPDPEIEAVEWIDNTDQLLKTAAAMFESLPEHHFKLPIKPLAGFAERLKNTHLFQADEIDTYEKNAAEWQQIESIYMGSGLTKRLPSRPSSFLSPDEYNAGIAKFHAFQQLKDLAAKRLTDEKIRHLGNKINERIHAITQQNDELEQEIIGLANLGPEAEEAKREWQSDIVAGNKTKLDIKALIHLYFHNDYDQYRNATGLSDTHIQKLHVLITQYVKCSQNLHQLQRVNSEIELVNLSTGDERGLRKVKLAQKLYAKNLIDPITEPELSVYQMYANILVRPIQDLAIKRLIARPHDEGFCETVERIIMAGGKSKVLLPILAYKKAQGNNLVIISVPNALLRTNYIDLKNSSANLFNQEAMLFEFNRNSDCSARRLETLYDSFIHAMVNKKYLVTTGDALQSLELKYLELLYSSPQMTDLKTNREDKIVAEWGDQVYWADKLVNLFRERGDLIIDEVHIGLLLKNKLNYTVGDTTKVTKAIIQNSVELFKFLKKCTVLTDKGVEIPFDRIIYNNQLISDPTKYKNAFDRLLSQLIEHPGSPLSSIIRTLTPENIKKLRDYLNNEGAEIPEFIQTSAVEVKNKLAFYKEQISHLLPYTFKKNHLEHFGPSQVLTHSPDIRALAIPYVANNTPNERSRFGSPLLTINYTIQSLLNNGISKSLLCPYLEMLLIQSKCEIEGGGYKSINDTPSACLFRNILGDSSISFSDLDMENDELISQIHQRASKNEQLIYDVLEKKVLQNIRVDPKILHSDAYNYVDFVRSCQGMSGTPVNHSTFHKRLNYDETSAQGVDGLVYQALIHKTDKIWVYDYTNTHDAITQLFGRYHDSAQLRAIIDISATFKGQDNLTIALAVADYLCKNPGKFQQTSKIKYILFFNKDNQICALPLDEFPQNSPIVIGSSDVETINARLGGGPEERFTIYDQAHITGTDITQAGNARALVMVDDRTILSNLFQGVMRMRGLIEESQRIDLVVPTALADKSIESIAETMYCFERSSLQEDNYVAACAQLKNSVRNHAMRMILAIEGEDKINRKHKLLKAFESIFFETQSLDLFQKYGRLKTEEDTDGLLEKLKAELLSYFQRSTADSTTEITPTDQSSLEDVMKTIIEDACKPGTCKKMQLTNQCGFGETVEVQMETQVEMEDELHHQKFDAELEPERYINWDIKRALEPDRSCRVMTLSEICQSAADEVPDFLPWIKASKNFFKSYIGQKNFLSMYLKPVHALLVKMQQDGGLECFILSQQEGVELAENPDILVQHKAWITTTQHTCLAGIKPEAIETNTKYQMMIEQIKYFNGEFYSLLTCGEPLYWLQVSSKKKLIFFENYLYPIHETLPDHLDQMRIYLLTKGKVFRDIISQLMIDGNRFDWQSTYPYLDEEAIGEIKEFCLACNHLHENWLELDLSSPSWYEKYTILFSNLGYLQQAIDKLQALKRVIQTVERHFDDIDCTHKVLEEFGKASHFYPALKTNSSSDAQTKHDLVRTLIDLMNAEHFKSSDRLIKLLASDPDVTSEQLQQLVEIAKTDSRTQLKLIQNQSKLIDESVVKQLIAHCQTKDSILALAKDPRVPSSSYRHVYEKANEHSCTRSVMPSLLQRSDCPVQLCLDFVKDEKSIFTKTELMSLIDRVESSESDSLEVILRSKHITAEARAKIAETTKNTKMLRFILGSAKAFDDGLLTIILDRDHDHQLLNEFSKIDLSSSIKCRLIHEPTASAELLFHCLNPDNAEHHRTILTHPHCSPAIINTIAQRSPDPSVLLYLIKNKPLSAELCSNLLSNSHISLETLEYIAEHAQFAPILTELLQRNDIIDSIRLKIINNKSFTEVKVLSGLFKSSQNPEIINAITNKNFGNAVDLDVIKSFLLIAKQLIDQIKGHPNDKLASQNVLFKLRVIKEYVNKRVDSIKFAINKNITSNRYIVFKTMSQQEKEVAIEEKLIDFNAVIVEKDTDKIVEAFTKLSIIACNRRNALTSFFCGKYSHNTKSATYLIDQFKSNTNLLNSLGIINEPSKVASLKKIMLDVCQNQGGRKNK